MKTFSKKEANIFERFGSSVIEGDNEFPFFIVGILGILFSLVGVAVSIADPGNVPTEVMYISFVACILLSGQVIWYMFGFKMVNSLIKYATADEIDFGNTMWNPDQYKWDGAEVFITMIPITLIVALAPVLVYHTWFIMIPLLGIMAIGWGVLYVSRKIFMLKKGFTQHVSDPNAHNNRNQTNKAA